MSELYPGAAFVTGGGSGIGRAIAAALAADGAPVAVLDLRAERGQESAAMLVERGGRAAFVRVDVSRWEDVDRAFDEAGAAVGPPAILVNAAGILDGYTPIEEMGEGLWERVLGINLTGTFFCCKRALGEMVRAGGGRIVNLASTAGLIGGGGGPAYVASKHGVVGLTRLLGTTYADRGITVNAICPGPVLTDLRANSTRILGSEAPAVMGGMGADEAQIRALVPAGRRGTLDEIAATARFLASADAAYITGHTLVVDGGWTAR